MTRQLVPLLLGLETVLGGVAYLPYEMTLTWAINADLVYFNLSIPTIRTTYMDWWGIGFKRSNETSDKASADITIVSKSGAVSDRWASNNSCPAPDDLSGGRNTLTPLFSQAIASDTVTGWYRKLDTGDVYDVVLEEGAEYTVLWAIGNTREDGSVKMHSGHNRGAQTLTFTNNYVDTGYTHSLLTCSLLLPLSLLLYGAA